jgi:hypothetical protein
VRSATYAGNCDTPLNMTQYMQFACEALTSCSYTIMPPLDPAFGCPKNFTYEYECYSPGGASAIMGQVIPPEAAGVTTFLFCSCAQDPI